LFLCLVKFEILDHVLTFHCLETELRLEVRETFQTPELDVGEP
jgi:hypothetical protein